MDELKTIGRNLKRLRSSAVMTQMELGLRVDLTKDTISKLELGKQDNIGLKYLVSICRVLEVELEALFIKDAKSIPIILNVSDGSVRAVGEIFKRVQEIMAKYGGKE